MLVLVLQHHPKDEPVREQRSGGREVQARQVVEHRASNARHVECGLARPGQREFRAGRPRILEGVVHPGQPFGARSLTLDIFQQPDFLKVRDVAQVPDDGGHEWVVLPLEVLIRERRNQEQRASSGLVQEVGDLRDGQRMTGLQIHVVCLLCADGGAAVASGARGVVPTKPETRGYGSLPAEPMNHNAIPRLEARGVTRRFGEVQAVDGVSLALRQGECLALVGESGSGKTTLLRMFNRLVEPDSGEVLVDGEPIRDADPIGVRRRFGYVPQHGGLIPHWSVARNVGLVPRLIGRSGDEIVRRALEQVGMPMAEFGARWPRSLSGGQRQRVALARALAHAPKALLLDEPFGALDALTRADLQRLFRDLVNRDGLSAILVTHDLHEARRVADRIGVMKDGRLVAHGTFEALTADAVDPYVAALFERSGVA